LVEGVFRIFCLIIIMIIIIVIIVRGDGLGVGGLLAGIAGAGSVEVVGDGLSPSWGAEGFFEFAFGAGEGLDEVLGEIGDGGGVARGDAIVSDGGDGVGDGGAEIAVGDVAGGEGKGDIAGRFIGGAVLGFSAGVEGAEVGVCTFTFENNAQCRIPLKRERSTARVADMVVLLIEVTLGF